MSLVPFPFLAFCINHYVILRLQDDLYQPTGVGENRTRKHPNNLRPPHTPGRVPGASQHKGRSSPASPLAEDGARAGLAEQNGAGFEEGKSKPASVCS